MSHVTHVIESCHTCKWVKTHKCGWVIWHIWISPPTPIEESCHTYERVTLNMWRSQGTPSNESFSTWMSRITRSNEKVTHMNEHVAYMSHAYVWHESFICMKGLIPKCDRTHPYVWHESCICVSWPIHMYDMTHSYVWQDSFVCATWLIHDVLWAMMNVTCERMLIYACQRHKCIVVNTCITKSLSRVMCNLPRLLWDGFS